MTTWYVRPDTSHSGTRNGTSYATAWGGWTEITWAGDGIVAGDTLYICGAHSYSTQLNMGAHGATDDSLVTIRGDYESDPGSIVLTSAAFILVNRNYTAFKNLTMTAGPLYCLYSSGPAITGITVQGCTFNGGTAQPIINMSGSTGSSYVDITIDDNDFIGGSGSTLGSAINWFVSAADATNSLTRMTITNNRFVGCSSARAVVELFIGDTANAASKMADVVIADNTFTDCYGVAMEAFGPQVYGRNTGLRITGNVIRDQRVSGDMGGAMSLCGFGPSTTDGFGSNIIARNEAYGLQGPAGFANVFYGTYRIFHNHAEDLTTNTIDGAGVLFDHGCDNCVAFGNRFKRLIGLPGIYYSGNGFTILDATNIKVFGNLVEDTHCAIHLGNKSAGQSSDIHNNTFLRCSMAVDLRNVADMTANLVRNNIFTATEGVTSVRVEAGTWTGESGNCFYGFGSTQGHTLHATDKAIDPELDDDFRPAATALKGAGTYLGGKDFTGKVFYNPPNIGAVDALPVAPRYALRQR